MVSELGSLGPSRRPEGKHAGFEEKSTLSLLSVVKDVERLQDAGKLAEGLPAAEEAARGCFLELHPNTSVLIVASCTR